MLWGSRGSHILYCDKIPRNLEVEIIIEISVESSLYPYSSGECIIPYYFLFTLYCSHII
jgi:hypothetical protein